MFNINNVVDGLKGKADDSTEGGLSDMMDMAKDFSAEDLERYKSMSKMELISEIKNSEHSATVIQFLKGLLDKKG